MKMKTQKSEIKRDMKSLLQTRISYLVSRNSKLETRKLSPCNSLIKDKCRILQLSKKIAPLGAI